MVISSRFYPAIVIFGGFGILLPAVLIGFVLRNPWPLSWPADARILAIGVAGCAFLSILFPGLIDDGE